MRTSQSIKCFGSTIRSFGAPRPNTENGGLRIGNRVGPLAPLAVAALAEVGRWRILQKSPARPGTGCHVGYGPVGQGFLKSLTPSNEINETPPRPSVLDDPADEATESRDKGDHPAGRGG